MKLKPALSPWPPPRWPPAPFAQTKWDLPAAYPATNFHTENLIAVRQRRRQGQRRQAEDHGARQRLAVQGARDQARGAGRPGADRRDPAGQLRQREPDLRARRRAVPGHQLRRREEARTRAQKPALDKLLADAGHEAAVHGAVAAAGHLHARRRSTRWPTCAASSGAPTARPPRRSPSWSARSRCTIQAAELTQAMATGVVESYMSLGLDRLRHQDLRAHQELVRHPGLAAEERGDRQPEGLRRARQADAGGGAQGRRRCRDARLEDQRRKRTTGTRRRCREAA